MRTAKHPYRDLFVLLFLVMLWLLAIVFDVWESLRGDYGWRWSHVPPTPNGRVVPLVLTIIIYIGGAYCLMRRASATRLTIWAILCGLFLIGAALYTHHANVGKELYLRTLSSGTTGWHYAGVQMDERGADEMLRTWPQVMEDFKIYSAHVAISPPGMAAGYHILNQSFEGLPIISDWAGPPLRAEQCHNYRVNEFSNAQFTTSALGGLLSPLLALLTVVPLFALGRRYFSETAARWAVLWWPLLPAVLVFQPYPSVIYPALTLPMVLALLHGLSQNKRHWMVIAGLIMSVVSFLNFSVLPLLLVAGLLALGIFFSQRQTNNWAWWWPVEMGAWYGLGLLIVWVGYYALYGVTFFEILEATFSAHLDLDRPYWPWLFLHLYDFGFFLGWPLLIVGLLSLWRFGKSARTFSDLSSGTVLGLAVVLSLMILTISGTGRGETGRVWMFFMPYLLLLGGAFIHQSPDKTLGWLITGVQGCVAVGVVAVIPAIGTDLTPPPATPTWPAQPNTAYIENGATYDNTITLQAFAGHIEAIPAEDGMPQAVLKLWIRWTSNGYVQQPYFVGILPVGPDGSPQTAYVAQPFNDGDLPMTCWLPERGIIEDYYEIPLDNLLTGEWWASVQILARDGTILRVSLPDGRIEQQTGIGPFQIP